MDVYYFFQTFVYVPIMYYLGLCLSKYCSKLTCLNKTSAYNREGPCLCHNGGSVLSVFPYWANFACYCYSIKIGVLITQRGMCFCKNKCASFFRLLWELKGKEKWVFWEERMSKVEGMMALQLIWMFIIIFFFQKIKLFYMRELYINVS
jgi:hypothetical protein